MNKVVLIGNLAKDPEFTIVGADRQLCRLYLAVSRPFSKEPTTDFFNLSVWGKQAEACNKYTKKGSKIAVLGTIQMRNYEGADGSKKTAIDIVVQEIDFLSKKDATTDEQIKDKDNDRNNGLEEVDMPEEMPF